MLSLQQIVDSVQRMLSAEAAVLFSLQFPLKCDLIEDGAPNSHAAELLNFEYCRFRFIYLLESDCIYDIYLNSLLAFNSHRMSH